MTPGSPGVIAVFGGERGVLTEQVTKANAPDNC